MSTNRITRVTRRRFLKKTGLTLAAAGSAPLLSAPFVSKALADNKSLSIVQWAHFVPEYDTWFDKFAKDWARRIRSRSRSTISPCRTFPRARQRKRRPNRDTIFSVSRRRWRASLPQVFYRRCRSREGNREKVRQGIHHRQAAWLQRRRRHLVCLPRFLDQLPGHVSKEPVDEIGVVPDTWDNLASVAPS